MLVILVLAVLSYLPAFKLSFISDDFPHIQVSRTVGEPGGINRLLANSITQRRITFFTLTWAVDRVSGLDPQVFHGVSLGLHVLACWLLYALGVWKLVGRKVALIAACFFTVYDGHQEAVMWYSAASEVLLCLFGAGALIGFIEWLRGKGWPYYALALLSFVLALLSQDSGFIVGALMLLPAVEMRGSSQRWLIGVIPFVVLAAADVAWIVTGSAAMGTGLFSAGYQVLGWGLGALAVLAAFKAREYAPLAAYAAVWILLCLLPGHTGYLRSAGLALLVAAALACIWERLGGRMLLAIGAVILMANVTILWRKRADEFRTRSVPTDMLINAVRRANGPIHIRCYPYTPLVAESAAREFGGSVVYEAEANQKGSGHCMNFWYKDVVGNVREIFVPPARLP